LNIKVGHITPKFAVDIISSIIINNVNKEKKKASEVDVFYINIPVSVRSKRLLKSLGFGFDTGFIPLIE